MWHALAPLNLQGLDVCVLGGSRLPGRSTSHPTERLESKRKKSHRAVDRSVAHDNWPAMSLPIRLPTKNYDQPLDLFRDRPNPKSHSLKLNFLKTPQQDTQNSTLSLRQRFKL